MKKKKARGARYEEGAYVMSTRNTDCGAVGKVISQSRKTGHWWYQLQITETDRIIVRREDELVLFPPFGWGKGTGV